MRPYVILDQAGEAYLKDVNTNTWSNMPRLSASDDVVCVRTDKAGAVTGRLFWPKEDASGMESFRFTIKADKASKDARTDFYKAKEEHFRILLARDIPGGAWFRHEMRQAQQELKQQANERPTAPTATFGDTTVDRTYELFSGGRAISENLQLDRALPETKSEEATVDIKTISGITVKEIDWATLIKGRKPSLDPLSDSIPADQHVIFFPTFAAAVAVADEAERQGTPVLYMAQPRMEDARTVERYQRQLGLSLTGLGRLLGPQVVKSIALTGSDPYYRTGTDVAVLFEALDPALLEKMLLTQIKISAAKTPTAKDVHGDAGGLTYRGVRSPDRAVCSYVARSGHAVVVTNSLEQLKRLADVAAKKTPSVASLPEYVFFRDRYKLGDADETGFVFLSDATIRRWCSPRWRIAASRRTRDAGVLAELQAENLDTIVRKTVKPGAIAAPFTTADIGTVSLDADGVRSSVQGSLQFLTPIVETPLDKVATAEKLAYERWRDTYQNNWRWAFDPIALRLSVKQNRVGADLTVMPLILGSRYRDFASITAGAAFKPTDGDRHDALLHFIMAINTKSDSFRGTESLVSVMSQGVTLGWVGSSVAFYVDDDPIWEELARLPIERRHDLYFMENLHRMPIAAQIDVSNGFRLAAFLAAARTWIEQTAPGMTAWETQKYKDQPYVKIAATEKVDAYGRDMRNATIYYMATGDALLITPHEGLLKRAIDRRLAREEAAKKNGKTADGKTPAAGNAETKNDEKPWLGDCVAVQADCRTVRTFLDLFESSDDRRLWMMQVRAWSNLPILNQWHRLYPDRDPVEVHEQAWQVRLLCPGGGKYVWNDKYQTMESTLYGCPAAPKAGPVNVPILEEFSFGSFGLSFENDGLRARVSLERDAKKK